MPEAKYRYNKSSLSYERIVQNLGDKVKRVFSYLMVGLMIAVIFIVFAYTIFDSPKEKMLKRELAEFALQYEILNNHSDQITAVLQDLQQRDDNIYRVIFEAEPIPEEIRKAGFGGVDRYKKLQGFENAGLMKETALKLDKLSRQLYIQSKC